MITTLNKIKEHGPCPEGWTKLLASLNKASADDEPLTFLHILNSNGLHDCIWAMRSAPEYDKEWRLFAVWCARQVGYLLTDQRSLTALDVAEAFANGNATSEELAAARSAAWSAAWPAARSAAWSAARSAAGDAARSAARSAAWSAAWDAARSAAWSAARSAAGDAARSAARSAAWDAQKNYLTKLFTK